MKVEEEMVEFSYKEGGKKSINEQWHMVSYFRPK